MAAPLIFCHSGFDPYLAFTLWQARRSNPDAPIWLIGDETNDLSALGVRHFRFSQHASRRDEFISGYRHFSGHQLENERFCLERWFYLESVLEHTGSEQFYFMDSDVLILMELEKLSPSWAGCDIAGTPIWGFGWFSRRELIRRFCDFTLDRYRNPQQLAEWSAHFGAGRDFNPPEGIFNVCDMTLWRLFERDQSPRLVDLRQPREGVVFDGCLNDPAGFQMRGAVKSVTRRPDGWFGHHEASAQLVRFAVLHLNGKYPKRLQPLFTGWPAPVLRACWRRNYRRNLRKLWLIATHSWRVRNEFFAPPPDSDAGFAKRQR